MIAPHRQSLFIDLAAVEAWDAWFRWREQADLRDFSIEDTWQRVAATLASAEPAETRTWQARFMHALASWRLLPDERLLANAGTGRITWNDGALHAVLNAATFVTPGAAAPIDLTAVSDCAALAVRALDNAALLAGAAAPRLRIGVVGMADALLLSGLDYDSEDGRALAGTFARTLAQGAFCASIALACDRGARGSDTNATIARAGRLGLPDEFLRDAERHGLRHLRATAITSQRRLALLANDVADALDPLQGDNHCCLIDAPDGQRTMHSAGYALNLLRARDCKSGRRDSVTTLSPIAQSAMRAAVQPWVDEPIAYPMMTHLGADPPRHEVAH